jgi:hypothetical protein
MYYSYRIDDTRAAAKARVTAFKALGWKSSLRPRPQQSAMEATKGLAR